MSLEVTMLDLSLWLSGVTPWATRFQCDRVIEFDYGSKQIQPVTVQSLVERWIGPSTIEAFLPETGRKRTFIVSRMRNIRDLRSGYYVRRRRFTQWLKK
jgi:hypothetical protein